MYIYSTLSTLAVATLFCAIASITPNALAVPVRITEMVMDLDPKQALDDAMLQSVADVYARNGMSNARDRFQRIAIGDDFQALALPDGGEQVRQELFKLMPGRIKGIEGEVEWKTTQVSEQRGAPTGVDRSDSRTGLDERFRFNSASTLGKGVDVYIIDTGCDERHPDLRGRVIFRQDVSGGDNFDANGHGTHCAATAAGSRFGFAKNASISCIKVFGAGPTTQITILRGLELVSQRVRSRRQPGVVNMSLGGPRGSEGDSSATARAIRSLVQDGVSVVVSAGNDGKNACESSPAWIPEAVTVGAFDPLTDTVARFSNTGPCVDLYGPGVDIESARTNTTESRKMSGTSMSAPHVAGALAVLMGDGLSRAAAEMTLIQMATRGAIKGDIRESANRMLYLDPNFSLCQALKNKPGPVPMAMSMIQTLCQVGTMKTVQRDPRRKPDDGPAPLAPPK